ncbi:MAG: PstA family ABC transporter permease [Bdellovibrionales bacterium]
MLIHKSKLDFVLTVLSIGSSLFFVGLFFWLLSSFIPSIGDALRPSFLFSEPQNAGREGGIFPIIVGTLAILCLSLLISFFVSFGFSIFLQELRLRHEVYGRAFSFLLFFIAGIPSIVFGLVGNNFFGQFLGLGYSILSGALTVSMMMIPLMTHSFSIGFRSIDLNQYSVCESLNLSKFSSYFNVLLPQIKVFVISGTILASGRVLAETAALLFTSGYVDRMPTSLFDSSRTLTIHIYDLALNVPGGELAAQKTSVILVLILLVTNFSIYRINHWRLN